MYKGAGIAGCSSRIDPVLADCGSMCETAGRCVQYFMHFKKVCIYIQITLNLKMTHQFLSCVKMFPLHILTLLQVLT